MQVGLFAGVAFVNALGARTDYRIAQAMKRAEVAARAAAAAERRKARKALREGGPQAKVLPKGEGAPRRSGQAGEKTGGSVGRRDQTGGAAEPILRGKEEER